MNQTTCFQNYPLPSTACLAYNGTCKVVNTTYSSCACPAGRAGLDCTQLVQPLTWVLVVCGTFYFLFFFFNMYMIWRNVKRTGGKYIDEHQRKAVKPSHAWLPKHGVLIFIRFAFFVYSLGWHAFSITASQSWIANLKFFTVQNFVTVVIYFALGCSLSVANLLDSNYLTSKFWRTVAMFHMYALHIELPMSLLVDLIYWGLLYPLCSGAPATCLTGSTFAQHMSNFFLMSIDALLSSSVFELRTIHAPLAFGSWYLIFEMCYTQSRVADFGVAPVYYFLSTATPVLLGWIAAMLCIIVICFLLVWATFTYCLKRKHDDFAQGGGMGQQQLQAGQSTTGGGPAAGDGKPVLKSDI